MNATKPALARMSALVVLSCEEEHAMSATNQQLVWEWPGDRSPDARVLVRVDAIDAGGASGAVPSPSVAGYLPDPVVLAGTVIAGDEPWVGRSVSLRLPRLELRSISSGSLAGLGVVGEATCICIASAPDDLAAAAAWLSTMPCGE